MKYLKRKKPEIVDISTKSRLFYVAGAEGLEPSARGFGDRCSTN